MDLLSLSIWHGPKKNRHKAFALVNYETPEIAQLAIRHMYIVRLGGLCRYQGIFILKLLRKRLSKTSLYPLEQSVQSIYRATQSATDKEKQGVCLHSILVARGGSFGY